MNVRTKLRRNAGALAVAVAALAATAAPAAAQNAFTNYVSPAPLGRDAGEPSIGVDLATGKVMYQAGLETLRVNLDAAPPTWTSVGSTITSTTSLDPILFTDQRTNRTFVSQLSAGCSLMAFSDNDGQTWTQNPLGCGLASGADHQTVGGGPFAAGGIGVGYPDATYYCAQAVATAQCSMSNSGGVAFNPAVPIYSAAQCGGLHGHIKVAPSGAAYVPNADCGGRQGFSVSNDNGTTWTVKTLLGSTTQDESDPSIGIGSGNTVYFGYADSRGKAGTSESHPMAAVYHPSTGAWSPPVDVGGGQIKNTQFPAMVAGDDSRAALAFLGTPTAGDDQSSSFPGVWHLYVAFTYDGGATWTLTDATPSDPVQKGCIWLGGGSNQCRNLLDFMDATVDKSGRVLVGYADGCTGTCPAGGANPYSAVATIARQSAGTGLYGAGTVSTGAASGGVLTVMGAYGGGPARTRPEIDEED